MNILHHEVLGAVKYVIRQHVVVTANLLRFHL